MHAACQVPAEQDEGQRTGESVRIPDCLRRGNAECGWPDRIAGGHWLFCRQGEGREKRMAS